MNTKDFYLQKQIQKTERFKFGIEALKEAIERVLLQKENKKRGSSTIKYLTVQEFKFKSEKYAITNIAHSDGSIFFEDINGIQSLYLIPIEKVLDIFDRIIRNANRQIRYLTKRISKTRITDRRSLFRSIIKFLFKNLDDAHSSLKTTALNFRKSLMNTINYDTSRYTNTYRFS